MVCGELDRALEQGALPVSAGLRERLPTGRLRTGNQLASAQVWVAQSSKLVQGISG